MRGILHPVAMAAFLAAAPACAGWINIDDAHRIAGRKCSADYLVGKVVMVCGWTADEEGVDEKLARMEELWSSFKTKNFVLIGSYRAEDGSYEEAKAKAARLGLTFPVYALADFSKMASSQRNVEMYVVDALGSVVYMGKNDRRASEVFVEKISAYDVPMDVALLKRIFEFEARELPGHAMIRYAMLKKSRFFSKNKAVEDEFGAKYKELKKIDGIRDLTELVAVSRKYKDYAPKTAMDRNRLPGRIEDALRRFKNLKDSENEIVAREARCAIADLVWKLAGVKKK